jgi:hypothetical protein
MNRKGDGNERLKACFYPPAEVPFGLLENARKAWCCTVQYCWYVLGCRGCRKKSDDQKILA